MLPPSSSQRGSKGRRRTEPRRPVRGGGQERISHVIYSTILFSRFRAEPFICKCSGDFVRASNHDPISNLAKEQTHGFTEHSSNVIPIPEMPVLRHSLRELQSLDAGRRKYGRPRWGYRISSCHSRAYLRLVPARRYLRRCYRSPVLNACSSLGSCMQGRASPLLWQIVMAYRLGWPLAANSGRT